MCVSHGIPWRIAWAMEGWELFATVVALGEVAEGGKFDWDFMRWEKDNV
jgi:hypothetical protein